MDFFWEKEAWEEEDPHLIELRKQPFHRPFPLIPTQPGFYTIRGPRQVGKSSWLKTILSHHLKKGHRCFYLSCETVENYKELHEILRSTREYDVLLLDEISFISEWDRAVKTELDLKSHSLTVLTGSNQVDLRRGIDRMPGRWGEGQELHLFPMDFFEFTEMRKQAEWRPLDLLERLLLYFKVGGFPRAVVESGSKGLEPKRARETYRRWLLGDAVKLGKSEIYLKEVLSQLAQTLTSPVSLQTLAKKTQIGSHHTVSDYIQFLEDFFAVRTLYAIDPDTGAFRFRKNKKFYFVDPLIYQMALEFRGALKGEGAGDPDAIAEMVAAETLFRRYDKFGYYDSKKGEVDFYSPREWAIEVKWASVPRNLSPAYHSVPALKKMVWTQRNFLEKWPDF